jgi:D-alanyl-D-alanine carboxypeptidase (penicillin-binding protein 5/6)
MKISSAAFRRFAFLEATTLKSFHFDVLSAKKENKTVWLKNTNKLIDRDLYLLGGKTGYTDEAGRCLVSKARYGDREIIALVLGADIGQNYEEVYQLLNFYFRN